MTMKTYVGDIGTSIILDCGQDITAASQRSIEVRKPDDTVHSWGAWSSGTTAVRFDTLADSLNLPGQYKMQAKVVTPSGTWTGETVVMNVFAAFD